MNMCKFSILGQQYIEIKAGCIHMCYYGLFNIFFREEGALETLDIFWKCSWWFSQGNLMEIGFIHIISFSKVAMVGWVALRNRWKEEWTVPGIGPTIVFGNRLTQNHQWKAARNHPHQTLYDDSPKVNTKGAWQENGNGYITIHASIPKSLNSISASHPIKLFANIQSQYHPN